MSAQASPESVRASGRPSLVFTYLFRNVGKTGPLVAIVALAVMLMAGVVSLIHSIPYSIKTIYSYSRQYLVVLPRGEFALPQDLVRRVKAEAPVPVIRTSPCRVTLTQVRSIVGSWPFVVLGLGGEDLKFFLQRQKVGRVRGRLPEAGAAEAIVSEPVARNLKLGLGGVLLSPKKRESYSPEEVKVVGIADTNQWFMVTSIEYQQLRHFPPIESVLFYAPDLAQQEKLNGWAMDRFDTERSEVFAYQILEKYSNDMFDILYKILNAIIAVIIVVLTFVMGLLMNIYQSQRLIEFGLLQAIGYTKRQILRRVMSETAIMVLCGWSLGVLLAYSLLLLAKATLIDPNAFVLDPLDRSAYTYTFLVPVALLAMGAITVRTRFKRFDPVGVLERRLV